jgi:hypothetical protein
MKSIFLFFIVLSTIIINGNSNQIVKKTENITFENDPNILFENHNNIENIRFNHTHIFPVFRNFSLTNHTTATASPFTNSNSEYTVDFYFGITIVCIIGCCILNCFICWLSKKDFSCFKKNKSEIEQKLFQIV